MKTENKKSVFNRGSYEIHIFPESPPLNSFPKSPVQHFKTTPFNSPFVKGDLVETASFNDYPFEKGGVASATGDFHTKHPISRIPLFNILLIFLGLNFLLITSILAEGETIKFNLSKKPLKQNLNLKSPDVDLAWGSVSFRTLPPTQQGDLQGEEVEHPEVGQQIYPHYSFIIYGTGSVTGRILIAWVDKLPFNLFGTLDAGFEYLYWSTSPITLNEGEHNLGGILDPDHTITETNENNNQLERIYLMLPDFSDAGEDKRSFNPQTIKAGEVLNIQCEIMNGGYINETTPFAIKFFASQDTLISDSDYFIGQTFLSNIARNTSKVCSFSPIFPDTIPNGIYYVGWIIDSDNVVAEINEQNNVAYKEGYQLNVSSPSDLIDVYSVNFFYGTESWASAGIPLGSSIPEFSATQGYLNIKATNNTANFGFWVSPSDAIPMEQQNQLYWTRWFVLTDQTNPAVVPQFRLRINSQNFQQACFLVVDSQGTANFAPTPSGRYYNLFLEPTSTIIGRPEDQDDLFLNFDILNFNPNDSPDATISLKEVEVYRLSLSSLKILSVEKNNTFENYNTEGWTFSGPILGVTTPSAGHTGSALSLQAPFNNTNVFGFYLSPEMPISSSSGDFLLRGTFEISSSLSDKSIVPEIRIRFNASDFQSAVVQDIVSVGDGAFSPGTIVSPYSIYFYVSPEFYGKGIRASFDMLNMEQTDSWDGSIYLNAFRLEKIQSPLLP